MLEEFSKHLIDLRVSGKPIVIRMKNKVDMLEGTRNLRHTYGAEFSIINETTMAEKKHWLQRKLDIGYFIIIKPKSK